MPEFLELLPPSEALQCWLPHVKYSPVVEIVYLSQAFGRVCANPITAPHALPTFTRSTVDGFAVRAADTFGASDSLPAYLPLVGEVPMGGAPSFNVDKAQCALIHTGGMLPEGANAVVMVENTQMVHSDEVELLRAVAPGENLLKAGEDVAEGEQVIKAGTRLRSAEIGGLAALGIIQVPVARQPRIAILSTGDEVVPVTDAIHPGQVRDVNTHTLSSLIQAHGGVPVPYGIIPDHPAALGRAAKLALDETDMVIITAGSSASTRDLTAQVINDLGKPGVLVHGVNVRPGKPTILGLCQPASGNPKPILGLPGNPVSAFVIAWLFVVPCLRHLQGLQIVDPLPSCLARLSINIPSQAGREDWIPVKLVQPASGMTAEPVFGKSNLIFTLARADGLIRIPAAATGLSAGVMVEVFLI